MADGYLDGSTTGVVAIEHTENGMTILVTADGKQYPKKCYVGRNYDPARDGELPLPGVYGTVHWRQAPPKPGYKYGSSYFARFVPGAPSQGEPQSNGHSNGQTHASNGKSNDEIIAQWALGRATDLLCVGQIAKDEVAAFSKVLVDYLFSEVLPHVQACRSEGPAASGPTDW